MRYLFQQGRPQGFGPLGLILDGDSFTEQPVVNGHIQIGYEYYNIPSQQFYRSNWGRVFANVALSGQTFAQRLAAIATAVYPNIAAAHAAGLVAVCSCWAGTNDIHTGTTDPFALFNIAKTYFTDCKAHGADFTIGFTITPAGIPGVFTEQGATCALMFNELMRARYQGIPIDALVDVAADVNMGNQSQVTSASLQLNVPNAVGYYNDSWHPNRAGSIISGQYFARAILSLQDSGAAIGSVTPASGPIAGGTVVTIRGTGFYNCGGKGTGFTSPTPGGVILGGIPAIVSSATDDVIVCTSQFSNVAGSGTVMVLGPNGGATTPPNAWAYT